MHLISKCSAGPVMTSHIAAIYDVIKGHDLSQGTDYGHTMVEFLILCSPKSNLIPNKYFGCGYKGFVFCRNNGWIMENIEKGADTSAKKSLSALEFICPICLQSPKVLEFNKKRLHWPSIVRVVEQCNIEYTANAYRQTTDKLMFKSVISTVRWIRK